MRLPLAKAWLVFLLAVPVAAQPALAATAYTLGVGDEVRVQVYEWRSTVGDVHEWSALNGKFGVGADGAVSFPLIGAVPAAGDTLEQFADAIGARLQKAVGLKTRPQASVEIIKYRPFYIVGSVNHPGEYPFRPGMTVLQAVSIAGGLFRLSDPSLLFGHRGVLTTTGDLRVLQIEYAGLLARQARLQAELSGSAKISFPRELLDRQKEPDIAQLIAQEQTMFAARNDTLRSETDALNRLRELLNGEVASLQAKMKNVDQEIVLLKRELTSTNSLVQRGLAAAPREFALRQTELQTEGRRLDLDAAALRAREDIGKADQSMTELRNKIRRESLTELAEIESKLSQTAARIRTNQMLLAQDSTGQEAAILGQEIGPPIYAIIRRHGNEAREISVTDATLVEPGDTIEVKRSGAGSLLAGAAPAGNPTTTASDPKETKPAAPVTQGRHHESARR